ncbi:hypothetical protein [Microbacterium tenebrionis]|uniref:Uncharacterized protein n=1 Tax=Microbacterium tenebrionis TaxID=2830665 RepID=A0A9X1LQS2_9MICO|nr:hypothetical protein [Microbacterium tenebrionis]
MTDRSGDLLLPCLVPAPCAFAQQRHELLAPVAHVAQRIEAADQEPRDAQVVVAGITLLLIQSSPLDEELERIAEQVFPLIEQRALATLRG